jgi:HEAT repeat protein
MRDGVGLLAAALLVVASAATARAERHPAEALTLGYQTEHADVVVLARPGSTTVDDSERRFRVTFLVERTLRGEAAPGAELEVWHPDRGQGRPWRKDALHLVFLRERLLADGSRVYVPQGGTFGFRRIHDGTPSERFPAIVQRHARALGDAGRPGQPTALRDLLIELAGDRDDGIASGAALDLSRHHELLEDLQREQRRILLEAFRSRPPSRARGRIARAVALSADPEAGRVLVDGLLQPEAGRDRVLVIDALRLLEDPAKESRVLARLPDSDPVQRRHLLSALGTVGSAASIGPVRSELRHAHAGVRIEAAHALGRVARNILRAAPGEPVGGRQELLEMVEKAELAQERKAALWALAQLDDPRAFDALRRLAADPETKQDVRRYAERVLARPRTSLVLE